ncbi:hypothetical protein BLOT_007535 [Blomia tropicalis]|nr:hypothetical protein BLOT_007535 [Blomia tropicalis]
MFERTGFNMEYEFYEQIFFFDLLKTYINKINDPRKLFQFYSFNKFEKRQNQLISCVKILSNLKPLE